MALKSKYITPDDFKEYFGIDLMGEFKEDDNPSNQANAFLLRIENRMSAYLNANFYRNIENEYSKFTDYQKTHYKLALLEQCIYVLRNGDISTDSGYEPDEGEKMNMTRLRNIVIAPNCKDELMLCGLWCRKIRNRARGGLDGWWMY